MKVNNTQVETVDWYYVVSNEGIYEYADDSRVYVVNVGSLEDVVLVYKRIADWLIYKRNISLFGKKDDYYYFLVNKELENSLKVMPIMMRISFGIFG